ncbi:Putative disease resistance protein [Arachis hypogaea]|nr:Putative disease resistance protein [Arachis hypogaea]
MAAAMVGGALLSASVQVLLDKIISNEFLDFYRRRKLNVSLLGKMKMKLKTMKIAEHAFGANNSSERSNLEGIGREIVKKCDGLPLAAVALGGLLRTKLSKND